MVDKEIKKNDMRFLGRKFYDYAYIESRVFQMSKFIVFDRCEFMSCQWSTQRHLFPGANTM